MKVLPAPAVRDTAPDLDTRERAGAPPQGALRFVAVLWKSLVWALLGSLVLESSLRAFGGGSLHPGAAGIGVLLLWSMVLMAVGLTGTPLRGHVVVGVLVLALAGINVARMKILVTPVLPGDVVFLRNPLFLVEMVGVVPVLLCAVVGVALVLTLVRICAVRGWGALPSTVRGSTRWRAVRLALVVQGVLVIMLCASFNAPGNVVRGAYEGAGASWMPWSQKGNYLYNGFVGGALYNLPVDPMALPSGYEQGPLQAIAKEWEGHASAAGGKAFEANLVVVLSESLGDVNALRTVRAERDPLAALRPVLADNWHGELVANYGTGTSSMEFQVLTGQSAALFRPQITSPYQHFVASGAPYPSAVRWLDDQGRSSVAVHPYTTEMYNRTNVYPALGVDRFVHEEQFEEAERTGTDGFITDREAYAKVLAQLRAEPGPETVHLVTMQNHLPYGTGRNRIPVAGLDSGSEEAVSAWLAGIERTAESTVEFLEDLRELPEPTVVIFFGDHFPGVFDQKTVAEEKERMYRTPFLIWSSADSAAGAAGSGRDLGVTSPTSLVPLALERAGAAQPPMAAFLAGFRTEVGALVDAEVVRPDGRVVARADLTAAQQRWVHDYELLQYDMSVGERWVADRMWATP